MTEVDQLPSDGPGGPVPPGGPPGGPADDHVADRGRPRHNASLRVLTLGALGVVFGDIGTSPLYTVQTVFTADHHAVDTTQAEVYGIISLIFWGITLIVSVKYLTFILRADNQGEGGIMALTALLQKQTFRTRRAKIILVTLGIVGASLFYGDGIITPAISVLSAVEGLQVPAPGLADLVLPISLAVLAMLFILQHFGTGIVGRLFGPVMVVWFVVLAVAGISGIARSPGILKALSPTYGAMFIAQHGRVAFISLASVVLAITGAEALYADMGHFGRSPIRRAWFLLVFPALALNYLGQGALILHSPSTIVNPFFLMIPDWAQIPMVLLATVATVIASQAVISGAFSVSRQAVQLGVLPRLTVRHTSDEEEGQVYAPAINWFLFVAVVVLVLGFRSSSRLASAYGIAVTATFMLNTILFLAVARTIWHKSKWLIALGAVVFLSVEVSFFAANLTKVVHGGWLPLVVAASISLILLTWQRGTVIVTRNRTEKEGSLQEFVSGLRAMDPPVTRVPGTAVFLNANMKTTPLALRANVDYNHSLHRNVVIFTVVFERVPHIPAAERLVIDSLRYRDDGITQITAHFGFSDQPDVPQALRLAAAHGLEAQIDVDNATYFLSKMTIQRTKDRGMPSWQKRLFLTVAHNAANPTEFYGLPTDRSISMGAHVTI
jgi:KUP system potassium uptake protein